jgi:hypothetical protein
MTTESPQEGIACIPSRIRERIRSCPERKPGVYMISSPDLPVPEGIFQGSLNTGRQGPRVRMIPNHNGGEERV